jgi:ankyrin repeat protein
MNIAIAKDDIQLAENAAKAGADINSALVEAVKNRRLAIAKLLIERGANPDGTKTAAAIDGEVKRSGQDYRYRLKEVPAAGPIFFAIYNGDTNMVRLLLEHGAHPTMLCAVEGATPGWAPPVNISTSQRFDHEYMRKAGFSVNKLPEYDVRQVGYEVVCHMVNPPAPVQAVMKTAIEYAAEKGNSQIVALLQAMQSQ